METIIDKAYARQNAAARNSAVSELMKLEKDIIDYDYEMYAAWIELCKTKGIAPNASTELLVDESNEELYEKFIHFSRLFVSRVREWKNLCHRLSIKRQIFPDIQRGLENERSENNNRNSEQRHSGAGKRQPGRSNNRRVSGRNAKRQR